MKNQENLISTATQKGQSLKERQTIRLTAENSSYYVFKIKGVLYIGYMVNCPSEPLMDAFFKNKSEYVLKEGVNDYAKIQKLN